MNVARIQPQHYHLYDHAPSLDDAWDYMKAHIPTGKKAEFFALLMTYHNTLVKVLNK